MAQFYQIPTDRPSVPIDFSKSCDTSTLKDQNVLITGGAMGIGKALVTSFAEAGAYVTIADLSIKEGVATFAELAKKGYHVQFTQTDVTSWASLVSAFKTSLEFGPNKSIDIVIPNAGIGGILISKWLENVPEDESGDPSPMKHKALDINLEAVYTTSHLALYYFKKFPGPNKALDKQIIFVSSMAGFSSMTNASEYCCSKWGVRGLFRSFRGAHKVLGDDLPVLRVNMINPGYIRTPLTQELHSLEDDGKMRMGRPTDVSEVVMRLCSDRNIIGRAVSVNAGMNFDLGDDWDGGEGYHALAERRKLWTRAAQQQQGTAQNGAKQETAQNGSTQATAQNGTTQEAGQNGTTHDETTLDGTKLKGTTEPAAEPIQTETTVTETK